MNTRRLLVSLLCTALQLIVPQSSLYAGQAVVLPVITDFSKAFDYQYLSFEKAITIENGQVHINAKDGQGGAGLFLELNAQAYADYTPALYLKIGPANRAAQIKVMLNSGEKNRGAFVYDLSAASMDQVTRLLPEHALALSPASASEPDRAFDPGAISLLQIQGDWKGVPLEVFLDQIELVPATPDMMVQRKAHTKDLIRQVERKREEAARRAKETRRLLAGAPHPDDGPRVLHCAPVAGDILNIILQAGQVDLQKPYPYHAQPGDEITPTKNSEQVLAWEKGRIQRVNKGMIVSRAVPGSRRKQVLGDYLVDENLVAPGPKYSGSPITDVTLQVPEAYQVASTDDPAFGSPVHPLEVYLKSKPTDQAGSDMPIQYFVYLKLHAPLKTGAIYQITFVGINTREKQVSYIHQPRSVRSPAVHVTQIGFRPDDPFKRAYLSTWLGTQGRLSYDVEEFELIDKVTGKTVYQGRVELGFAFDRKESIRGNKNHTQTDVYHLDFHTFNRPGTYCVYVPDVGVSFPFTIGEEVWTRAFRKSMHGFLSHRSGMELKGDYTHYQRPRPMHPTDGVKVFELPITFWKGEASAVQESLNELLGPTLDTANLKVYADAWGGYMDAGDWDRRSQHLTATYAHLELLDMFPQFFEGVSLALPPGEARDRLPDILNEALWNLDFFRRLQRPHGGVGGGVESTSHPRPGEASWQESLVLGTFAPDPESSLRYAACAAKAARLMRPYAPAKAQTYADSARKAWQWAVQEGPAVLAEARQRQVKNPEAKAEAVQAVKALAAVELYRLTGDVAFHRAFEKHTTLSQSLDPGSQLDAIFAYTLVPASQAEQSLQLRAIQSITQAADVAWTYGQGNAFNICCRVANLPVIGYVSLYSVPESTIGPVLPRAHFLTGDIKYLAGAVAAANYSAGANPMNMTLTKGVGIQYPRAPLHIDSRHAGIEAPDGITVYGPGDPSIQNGSVDWAHTWYLSKSMVPNSRTWPTAEFYVDLPNWPPMTEYTVHQTFRPTSYYWGYLAARHVD